MSKAADAFRTISEVADELDVPKHVLRFWENRFPHIRPMKRGGGRRYYRPEDLDLLRGIKHLLHNEGYTIKGVQKILREHGVDAVKETTRAAHASKVTAVAGVTPRGRGAKKAPVKIAVAAEHRTVILAAIRELEAVRGVIGGAPRASQSKAASRRAG